MGTQLIDPECAQVVVRVVAHGMQVDGLDADRLGSRRQPTGSLAPAASASTTKSRFNLGGSASAVRWWADSAAITGRRGKASRTDSAVSMPSPAPSNSLARPKRTS